MRLLLRIEPADINQQWLPVRRTPVIGAAFVTVRRPESAQLDAERHGFNVLYPVGTQLGGLLVLEVKTGGHTHQNVYKVSTTTPEIILITERWHLHNGCRFHAAYKVLFIQFCHLAAHTEVVLDLTKSKVFDA